MTSPPTSTTTHTTSFTMFKSILPSRKMSDSDFLMITSPVDSHKENYPAMPPTATATTKTKSKKSKGKESPMEAMAMDQAFDQLLVRRRSITEQVLC